MHERFEPNQGGIRSLFRFLGGYAAALLILFFALPVAGRFLEDRYDALDGPDKLLLALAAALSIGISRWLSRRRRRSALA